MGAKLDRKSTRLNSSHLVISYAVFCLKKKKNRLLGRQNASALYTLCRPLHGTRTHCVCIATVVKLVLISRWERGILVFVFFFFNDTATTEIYTLSLHDALPISKLSGMPSTRNSSFTFRAGS